MKFGYILQHFEKLSQNPEIIENRAANIHMLGFDSLWITDHVLLPKGTRLPKYERITESITTLAYLAGKIDYMEFGLSTLVLPLREPILVAKQLSTLHYFLEDRMSITFGAGWSQGEFENLGQDFSNRGKRFDEQLELILSLWKGNEEFRGDYYSYSNAKMDPIASTIHNMPLYIAGNSNYAVERSLRYCDGFWHPANISHDKLELIIEEYSLNPSKIILRLGIKEEEDVGKKVETFQTLGIEYIIFDDYGNLKNFENIISYTRQPMEVHP